MFVTGADMNFDLNAISTLVQMLAKPQPPKQPADGRAISPFARENGIGERIELSQKTSAEPMAGILEMMGGKKNDMMASLMPLFANAFKKPEQAQKSESNIGQKSSGNFDNNRHATGSFDKSRDFSESLNKNSDFSGKLNNNSDFSGNINKNSDISRDFCDNRAFSGDFDKKRDISANGDNVRADCGDNNGKAERRIVDARERGRLSDGGMFAPISFAGYGLISALNILYHYVNSP